MPTLEQHPDKFTLSPDQKGIETFPLSSLLRSILFTLSPDQKGIETLGPTAKPWPSTVPTEPRSKGD